MSGPANTQFSVAAHALVYLAGVGAVRPVSSAELASSVNVTPVHIRRVLGPLRAGGLVRSRPGIHGGWELARPARDIRLDEVWDAVPGGEVLPIHSPSSTCPVGLRVRQMLDELEDGVNRAVSAELHGHTVAGLVAAIKPVTATSDPTTT